MDNLSLCWPVVCPPAGRLRARRRPWTCAPCLPPCLLLLPPSRSPDVHFVKELKHDELAESDRWSQQAKAVQGNVFRWLAQTRDTAAVSSPSLPVRLSGPHLHGLLVIAAKASQLAWRVRAAGPRLLGGAAQHAPPLALSLQPRGLTCALPCPPPHRVHVFAGRAEGHPHLPHVSCTRSPPSSSQPALLGGPSRPPPPPPPDPKLAHC